MSRISAPARISSPIRRRAKAAREGLELWLQISESVRGRRNPDRDIAAQRASDWRRETAAERKGSALACAPTWPLWPGGPRHVQSRKA
jgi:hypothetical protein